MKCKCGKNAVKDGLCRKHWIESKEAVFLDNSNRDNIGILEWAKFMLPEYTPNSTPDIHRDISMLILELWDPIYTNRQLRQRNIISYRGSAKSTLVNMIISIYLLCHNGMKMKIKGIDGTVKEVLIDERFIVIASETGISAEDFTVRIRDELTTNEMLRYFYGLKIEDAIEADTGQWTRRAFKFNKCFLMGVGIGQQIRGKIKGAYRITTFLADDLYSENNIKTFESRRNVRYWFNNSAINSIDDLRGKAVVLGTILHEDTILVDNKNSKNWKTVEFPLMPIKNFEKFIKEHLDIDYQRSECRLPFEEEQEEFIRIKKQKEYYEKVENSFDWGLAWKDRTNLFTIALKFQELVEKRMVSSMYQEYFHVIVSETEKKFKKEYFQYMDGISFIRKYGLNWLLIEDENKTDTEKRFQYVSVNVELGIDIGSGSIDGDDTSIAVVAVAPNRKHYVLDVKYGKLRMRDIEVNSVKITGLFDEIIRLAIEYCPYKIKIGYAGDEKGYISLIRQYLEEANIYCMVIGRPQTRQDGNKYERIARTLLHLYESRLVYHKRGMDKLEFQLEMLGKAKEDDLADALEVAVYHATVPMLLTIEQFEPQKTYRRPFSKMINQNYDWRTN